MNFAYDCPVLYSWFDALFPNVLFHTAVKRLVLKCVSLDWPLYQVISRSHKKQCQLQDW